MLCYKGPALIRGRRRQKGECVNLRNYLMERSRYFVVFALVCAVSVALAACGGGSSSSSSSETEPEPTTSTESTETSGEDPTGEEEGSTEEASSEESAVGSGVEGLKVAWYTPTSSANAYAIVYKQAMEAAAKKFGVELSVLESEFNAEEQIHQMQLAEQRDSFDAWIVGADSGIEECNPIKQSIANGIPIMISGGHICDGNEEGIGTIGFVGVQGPEAYGIWAHDILSENEPQELGLVVGPAELELTEQTEEAFEKEGEKYPGFKVVAEQTDYTTGGAYKATQDLLNAHPDMKLIASNYAGMTVGVLQAIKAAGDVGKIKVYDLLAEKIMKKAIEKGEVYASIPGLPASEAEYAMEAVVKNAEGKKVPPTYNPLDELTFKGAPLVKRANVAEFEPQY